MLATDQSIALRPQSSLTTLEILRTGAAEFQVRKYMICFMGVIPPLGINTLLLHQSRLVFAGEGRRPQGRVLGPNPALTFNFWLKYHRIDGYNLGAGDTLNISTCH